MDLEEMSQGIMKLGGAERIMLVEDIWDRRPGSGFEV